MAHTSSIFDSQPIRVQNVNGFDLSHINCGTALCGTLTPVLCRLLMPRTKFDLGCSLQVELPPLATSFFGRIDAHVEVFFCPCSVIYGGWKQFISGNLSNLFPALRPGTSNVWDATVFDLPRTTLSHVYAKSQSEGSLDLSDYLGIRAAGSISAMSQMELNILPFVAYAKIWDTFYRNPSVTKTIFAVNTNVNGATQYNYRNIAYIWHSFYTFDTSQTGNPVFDSDTTTTWPDGFSFDHMRQRCYPRDYFTAASLSPQQGTAPTLKFTVTGTTDTSSGGTDVALDNGEGQFTIHSLRAVNALQKFLEASNYSPGYRESMRAHFGINPSDADLDEPSYIGRLVVPVYQKSVYTQSEMSGSASGANPFNTMPGSKTASGSFVGEGSICHNYEVKCFGYLMGIFSLVPHAMYGYGIDRHFRMLNLGDFPFPELQSVGMDAIKNTEIFIPVTVNDSDFGYIPRYSYFKYVDDSVHGLLRPGKSLAAFVLQRRFAQLPVLSTSFCEIPTNALDSLFASTAAVSGFSCWYEVFWVFKATMPLAAFCVPTLGELQDTHTIKVPQGGSRL